MPIPVVNKLTQAVLKRWKVVTLSDFAAVVINIGAFTIVCMGVLTSVYVIGVNRSLWADEAFLASSFSQRSFLEMVMGGEFDYLQSAPLGWLCMEKILSMLLSNVEWVLRIGSLFAYVATIIIMYAILRLGYLVKFPLIPCALYANTPFILQYSGMFKPYLFDGFVASAVVFALVLHNRSHLRFAYLAIIMSVAIWFSSPCIFVEAGLIFGEIIVSAHKKDFTMLRKVVLLGLIISSAFVTYYFVWVRRMTSVSAMQEFWANSAFPLVPTSINDLEVSKSLCKGIVSAFGNSSVVVLPCLMGSFIYSVSHKDSLLIGVFAGFLATIVASSCQFYPAVDRLWLFSVPLILVVCHIAFEGISCKACSSSGIAVGASLLVLAMLNGGVSTYLNHPDNVYMKGQELNTEIDYLHDNICNGDTVYVSFMSCPQFKYKNGYNNDSLTGVNGTATVLFGKTRFRDTVYLRDIQSHDYDAEIATVLLNSPLYIVSSHTWKDDLERLANVMHESGHLELVSYEYETPLWWYCSDLSDCKTKVSFEVDRSSELDNMAIVTVINVGRTCINHPFDDVYLLNNETGEAYELPNILLPGESWSTSVSCSSEGDTTLTLRSSYGLICVNDSVRIDTSQG